MNIKSSPKPKMHLVVGKIYSNGCIHCVMMSKEWDEMKRQIQNDMNLVDNNEKNDNLTQYHKYVSKNGDKVVEVIELESDNMYNELPYMQKKYSSQLDLQGGFPTIFKISNKKLSYYGGKRTAKHMKTWYLSKLKTRGGYYTRRKNKTQKNKTRVRYHR